MTLGLTLQERIARARGDLAHGAPVVVTADGAGAVALAAETATDARLGSMRALGGPICLAVTARRAKTLKARAYDGDIARVIFGADRRAVEAIAISDPSRDLAHPMLGPHRSEREGPAGPHRLAIRLCKAARLLPAAVVASLGNAEEARAIAARDGLTVVDLTDMADADAAAADLTRVAGAHVPLAVARDAQVHVFRPADGAEEHYAIEIGEPPRDAPVLSRLHSACFTGDLIGSLKCDCGPQLRAALDAIGREGRGVLLYLNQEGRGIGLANKMRAYSLQDEGFDTVEANHRLGFEDDERDFRIGAAILQRLGFDSVRLMTNNPAKVAVMEACDVRVAERVPLMVGENALNAGYLATKAAKSGHLL